MTRFRKEIEAIKDVSPEQAETLDRILDLTRTFSQAVHAQFCSRKHANLTGALGKDRIERMNAYRTEATHFAHIDGSEDSQALNKARATVASLKVFDTMFIAFNSAVGVDNIRQAPQLQEMASQDKKAAVDVLKAYGMGNLAQVFDQPEFAHV